MYTYNDELYHYGVLGMKWGIRRYQNPDGTRTALGKKRERAGNGKTRSSGKKAAAAVGVVTGLGIIGKGVHDAGRKMSQEQINALLERKGDQPSAAERIGKDAGRISDTTGRIINRVESKRDARSRAENRARQKKQAARLSDKELRDRVNRMQLEKQYVSLLNDDYDDGSWSTKDKIELGNDIVNGLVTAGTLALSIYTLKKKMGG